MRNWEQLLASIGMNPLDGSGDNYLERKKVGKVEDGNHLWLRLGNLYY